MRFDTSKKGGKKKLDLSNDDLKTLSQCMNSLKKYDFNREFRITKEGMKSDDGDRVYSPHEVKIINFYRFEGESDPADMSILYAIETIDGERGVLVDAYGPYASRVTGDFIVEVEKIHKKVDRNKDYKEEEEEE